MHIHAPFCERRKKNVIKYFARGALFISSIISYLYHVLYDIYRGIDGFMFIFRTSNSTNRDFSLLFSLFPVRKLSEVNSWQFSPYLIRCPSVAMATSHKAVSAKRMGVRFSRFLVIGHLTTYRLGANSLTSCRVPFFRAIEAQAWSYLRA